MKWRIDDCKIIGGMRSVNLSAPFSRANIVVSSSNNPGYLLCVYRNISKSEVSGEFVLEEDWDDLNITEEALTLYDSNIALVNNAAMWLIRPGFKNRANCIAMLRECEGAVIYEETHGDVYVFIVNEPKANVILDRWSEESLEMAWQSALKGQWAHAVDYARLSWLLCSGLKQVAMYVFALDNYPCPSKALSIIDIESRNRNRDEMSSIYDLIDQYRNGIAPWYPKEL